MWYYFVQLTIAINIENSDVGPRSKGPLRKDAHHKYIRAIDFTDDSVLAMIPGFDDIKGKIREIMHDNYKFPSEAIRLYLEEFCQANQTNGCAYYLLAWFNLFKAIKKDNVLESKKMDFLDKVDELLNTSLMHVPDNPVVLAARGISDYLEFLHRMKHEIETSENEVSELFVHMYNSLISAYEKNNALEDVRRTLALYYLAVFGKNELKIPKAHAPIAFDVIRHATFIRLEDMELRWKFLLHCYRDGFGTGVNRENAKLCADNYYAMNKKMPFEIRNFPEEATLEEELREKIAYLENEFHQLSLAESDSKGESNGNAPSFLVNAFSLRRGAQVIMLPSKEFQQPKKISRQRYEQV